MKRNFLFFLVVLILSTSGCAARIRRTVVYVGGSLQDVGVTNNTEVDGDLYRDGEFYTTISAFGETKNIGWGGSGERISLMFKYFARRDDGQKVYLGLITKSIPRSQWSSFHHEWIIENIRRPRRF